MGLGELHARARGVRGDDLAPDGYPPGDDLSERAAAIVAAAGPDIAAAMRDLARPMPERVAGAAPVGFSFPMIEHPCRPRSLTAERTPEVAGVLLGMKGQYVILDTGVLNVRRHGGYEGELAG